MTYPQFKEVTAFNGEISVHFHLDEKGKPFHAYAEPRHVDDTHEGLKSRHFHVTKGTIYGATAKPEAISYLWKHWKRFVNHDTE